MKAKKTYYRIYKKLNSNLFKVYLALSLDRANKDYDSFEDAFIKTLNRHVPMKKKFARAHEVTYMTKTPRNAILKRSELKSKNLKIRNEQSMNNFIQQNFFCRKLYKKQKKKKRKEKNFIQKLMQRK